MKAAETMGTDENGRREDDAFEVIELSAEELLKAAGAVRIWEPWELIDIPK